MKLILPALMLAGLVGQSAPITATASCKGESFVGYSTITVDGAVEGGFTNDLGCSSITSTRVSMPAGIIGAVVGTGRLNEHSIGGWGPGQTFSLNAQFALDPLGGASGYFSAYRITSTGPPVLLEEVLHVNAYGTYLLTQNGNMKSITLALDTDQLPATQMPEPSTLVITAGGLAVVAALRRT